MRVRMRVQKTARQGTSARQVLGAGVEVDERGGEINWSGAVLGRGDGMTSRA